MPSAMMLTGLVNSMRTFSKSRTSPSARELLANKALRAHQAPLDRPAKMAPRVALASLDLRVHLVLRVPEVPMVIQAPQVRPVLPGLEGFPAGVECLVESVKREKRVLRVRLVKKVMLVFQVTMVCLVQSDLLVDPVVTEQKEKSVNQAHKV